MSIQGKLYEMQHMEPYTIRLLKSRYTHTELIQLVRTLGKRAQSRIKELEKWYNPKSSRYKYRLNPLLEQYRGYNVQTMGLSDRALYKKVKDALAILNDKRSMKYTYEQIFVNSYEKFKSSHPRAKDWTFEQWERIMRFMGAYAKVHESEQYDSEQILGFATWQAEQSIPLDPEEVTQERVNAWFLDRISESKKGQWVTLKDGFDFDKATEWI